MKNSKCPNKIINLLFILNILFNLSVEDIFNNPLLISEKDNPLPIRGASGTYYIFTSGEQIILYSNGEIKSTRTYETYNAPYVWVASKTNSFYSYYIFSSNKMLKVFLSTSNPTIVTKPSITFPISTKFLGSITESKNDGDTNPGCLCPIIDGEVIIYGRGNRLYIVFSFIQKLKSYSILLSSTSMEEKMSCKKIENGQYLCAVLYGYIVQIYLFSHLSINYSECEMRISFHSSLSNLLNHHTNLDLYDTDTDTKKIVCAKNLDTLDIECVMITISIKMTKGTSSCTQTQDIQTSDIIMTFPTGSGSREDCFYKKFVEESLFCCGDTDKIKCARFKENYDLIAIFDLEFPGQNSRVSFFTDSNTYGALFFMNKNSGNKYYEYSIFLPECKDLNYTIIVLHSINEEKSENEKDNLNYLFERKTSTDYYFEFESLPDDYGYFLVNNEKIIEGNNTKILLENGDSYILDFVSNTDNSIANLQVPFKIVLKETYSAQCSINLKILPCYDSCSQCSKDKSLSTSENHNCLEDKCKGGYYPSPILVTNCFSEAEKEINWYLDNSTKRFALCDNNCNSCYGPNSNNCLTCFSPEIKSELNYLYSGRCINQCPEGTFVEQQTEGFYICQNCYINCKTCNEKGEENDMKCDLCFENDITYNKNCYKEYNGTNKTFYKPESTIEITSCHEFLGYYIEENTYECISSMPNTGYYLVNSITGLFAKCHSDCKTCSRNYTESSSNCDSCNNGEFYLLDGNCISVCPEGYYPTISNSIKICVKCYKHCKSCNQGESYDNSDLTKITNMNCLECLKVFDPINLNNLIDNKILVEGNCFPIITYTEEKIIFDVSDLNNGENEKTCLDYGKAIFYDEYQCKSKPTNSYYVLNNEENTGVIKTCDESCATCNEGKNILASDTNCITCVEGYFKTEDSKTNCLLENLIPENYLKNNSDNIYYKCYPSCKKCGDFYNSQENDMNCIECATNFYFVYDTNNCYEMNFVDENSYFFSNEDNKFHKCYFSCSKCSQINLDENNHNCDECLSSFHFEYNTKNCYNNSILERGYYLDDDSTYKKCYKNCKTCSSNYFGDNMNCISCKDNFYKKLGTNNCYDESLKDQGYYLKDDIFYKCEENCKTCSNSKTITNGITSNNCLSCDFETKGLYLVSNLGNCEPESFKNNGYYLGEDPDNPDIKIFYKCYQSCSLCDKGEETSEHNCFKCKVNYYPLKVDKDNNPKNCYNAEEMLPQGYNLVRNYWQICHENCEDCSGKPDYDIHTKLISQNCLSCYGDLHLIYDTSDCSDDSILSRGFYFDENDSKYHKCDIKCKTCDKYSTSTDPKCTSCNEDLLYYLAYDKPSTNCYNRSMIGNKYILSEFENTTTGEVTKKWMICYETCRSCNILGNETENKCTSCINKYYLIYGTSNCLFSELAEEKGYYLNTTYNQYVKCDKACLTCTKGLIEKNTNCKKCNMELGYYPIKGKSHTQCFNEENIGEGYFLNKYEEPFQWEECYENCASCEYKGNSNRMACLSCKKDFIYKALNKNVYLKFTKEGNCNVGCPENLFLTKQLDCLPSCLNGTYEFIPNVTCVDTCPEHYIVNEERTRCVYSAFAGVTTPEDFKDIIFQNISNYVDSTSVINGTNFIAQIISASDVDPVEQINKGISGLDLGDCIEVLKTHYNIPENEDLIVIEIETTEDKEKNQYLDRSKDCIDLGKNVKLSICDIKGNILDMSFCQNEITVMKYIGDFEDIDLDSAIGLAEQGIDVFNTQDSFFNDRCSKFKSDKDIILNDRRSDIFQNVSFCGDECLYNGMDYTLMVAKCSCNPSNIQDSNSNLEDEEEFKKGITLNDLANSFTSEIFAVNFDVIKCYNLVFDSSILKKNKGFISNIIMFGLQILLLIYFLTKRLKPIRNYMLVFEPFDPRIDPPNPPKLKKYLKTDNDENKKENIYNFMDIKSDNVNNKNKNRINLSKKEKEIKKSRFINELLNRSISKKKKDKDKNNPNDDNILVVHYINSDESEESEDSSSNKSDEKESQSNNNIYKSNNSNSSSNSEDNKTKNKKGKGLKQIFSNPKIYERNNNNLNKGMNSFHIFSKETIVPENKKHYNDNYNDMINQKQTLTLESNEISPRNINFDDFKSFGILNSPRTKILKSKDKGSVKNKKEEKDDEKSNSRNNYSFDLYDVKRRRKKLVKHKNKKTLKDKIKSRNENRRLNILGSTDEFFFQNKETKKKKFGDTNSVKYYFKNKINENNQRTITLNEIGTNPESPKKTENEMNKKKGKKDKEQLGNMRLKYKKVNYALTYEEINDMDFEEALIHDNRPFYRIYVAYLLEEHIIFNTICTDMYLDLRSIKLSFLIFGYEISFFLNALFYTDEYISDTYHNDGVLDFFSSLPKSIYSFIVTLVLSGLLKMLSSSKKQLNKIIKEREDKKEYLEAIEKELNKLKIKIVWYYIIVFILGIFFVYYVSAFCAVYQNSQTFWLIGCFESMALDFITPFLICLILSVLRYIGIKSRSSCAYKTAKILNVLM